MALQSLPYWHCSRLCGLLWTSLADGEFGPLWEPEEEEVVGEVCSQCRPRPLSDEERAEINSLVERAQGELQRYDAVLASEAASCACLPPYPPCEPRECMFAEDEEVCAQCTMCSSHHQLTINHQLLARLVWYSVLLLGVLGYRVVIAIFAGSANTGKPRFYFEVYISGYITVYRTYL